MLHQIPNRRQVVFFRSWKTTGTEDVGARSQNALLLYGVCAGHPAQEMPCKMLYESERGNSPQCPDKLSIAAFAYGKITFRCVYAHRFSVSLRSFLELTVYRGADPFGRRVRNRSTNGGRRLRGGLLFLFIARAEEKAQDAKSGCDREQFFFHKFFIALYFSNATSVLESSIVPSMHIFSASLKGSTTTFKNSSSSRSC